MSECAKSSLNVAVLLDAYEWLGAPAALALQRHVPDEGCGGDTRRAKKRVPGDIGDSTAARTGDADMRIALGLCLGDGPGAPVRLGFHPGIMAPESDREQAENVSGDFPVISVPLR